MFRNVALLVVVVVNEVLLFFCMVVKMRERKIYDFDFFLFGKNL